MLNSRKSLQFWMIKKIDIIRKALVIHQLICFTWPMNLYCLQDLSTKGEWNRNSQGIWNLSSQAYYGLNFMCGSMHKYGEKMHFGTRKELRNSLIQGSHFTDEWIHHRTTLQQKSLEALWFYFSCAVNKGACNLWDLVTRYHKIWPIASSWIYSKNSSSS